MPTVYGGLVYCAALDDGTSSGGRRLSWSSVSIAQIISAATALQYPSGTTTLIYTVSGLEASTLYNLYAYAISAAGYGTSLDDIKAFCHAGFRSRCCKGVTFTNSPLNVYGNVSVYANVPASHYVFSYSLSAAPQTTILVTPVVIDVTGVVAPEVSVVPSFASFDANSVSLSGSFYVTAPPVVSGAYSVYLNLTDVHQSYDFNDTTVASDVNILFSYTPLPGPKLAFSRFSQSGAGVFIGFDAPTDNAGINSTFWNCSHLFVFVGSESSNCSWVDSKVVKAQLPFYSSVNRLLQQNDTVVALSNKIKASCVSNCSYYEYSAASVAHVMFSNNPVSPVPVLLAPSTLSACNNLIIDATLSSGAGSRPWNSTVWNVVALNGSLNAVNVDAILAILQSVDIASSRIHIPASILQDATYTFTLTLTNFQGKSGTATATVTIVGDVNQPSVSIQGPSVIAVNPSQVVTLFGSAQPGNCSNSRVLSYHWTLWHDGSVQNISNVDQRDLIIEPYTLVVGSIYQARLIVTASSHSHAGVGVGSAHVAIVVVNGNVNAVVKGGYYRAVAITETAPLLLDASTSSDDNKRPGEWSDLTYSWACIVSSTERFGDNCASIFGSAARDASNVSLWSVNVNSSLVYDVMVHVTASDGRSATTVVTVKNLNSHTANVSASDKPYTYVSTAIAKFNAGDQFTLHGILQGQYELTATWHASVGNVEVPLNAMTVNPTRFSATEVSSQISFPISCAPNTFTPGSHVTFKLYAQRTDDASLYSYSAVTVAVNAAPSGGDLTVTPLAGVALSTDFTMLATGWSDDPSDYPLTYEFSYSLSRDLYSTIRTVSTSTVAESVLPAGLQSFEFEVTLRLDAYDSMTAEASRYTSVTVNASSSANISSYVSNALAEASATSDTSITFQVINNAASALNYVNCSLATPTYCAGLNRDTCISIPNTCSGCLSGFVGVPGASNAKCLNASLPSATNCLVNDDCVYGLCEARHCEIPQKQCISTFYGGVPCSGHGQCTYFDPSNNVLGKCLVTNLNCTAVCECDAGYGGVDCSLTSAELSMRNAVRTELCDALHEIVLISNPTSLLVSSAIISLYLTYNPWEVTTGLVTCHSVLSSISILAAEGYLVGTDYSVGQNLILTTSLFFQANVSELINLSGSLANITDGLLLNMANGQAVLTYTSDNVHMALIRDATSRLSNRAYSPPFAGPTASLSFVDGNNTACDNGYGYAQLSVIGFGTNPYPKSFSIVTPIFRTESHAHHDSQESRRLTVSNYTDHSRVESLDFPPAYYFTLQFTSEQNFDFSVDRYSAEAKKSNTTFPLCQLYDGTNYVPCDSCNIASYTNYNVTYGCSDITQICHSSGEGRRMTTLGDENLIGSFYDDIVSGRRTLFTLTGDDDGTMTESGSGTVSQYGAIVKNLLQEQREVFSVNVFAIDPKKSAPVLTFVSALFFIFVVGMLFFLRWDRLDHHQLIYTKDSKLALSMAKSRTLLEEYHRKKDTSEGLQSKSHFDFMQYLMGARERKNGVIDRKLMDKEDRGLAQLRQETLYDELEDQEKYVSGEVSTFLNFVMPLDHKVLKNKQFEFATALKGEHQYFNVFTFASVAQPRVVRWCNICLSLVVCLFLDALFFGQFYQDRGHCEGHTNNEEACNRLWNKASNRAECTWTPNTDPEAAVGAGTCTLNSPPSSAVFTIIIMTLTVVIGVQIMLVFEFLLTEVCAKRPDLEFFGWDPSFVLNSESHKLLVGSRSEISKLSRVFDEAEEVLDAKESISILSEESGGTVLKRQLHQINENAHRVYDATVSTVEEVDKIYADVAKFIAHYSQNYEVPWRAASAVFEAQRAKAAAIAKNFNVDVTGKSVSLSLRQLVTYGSARKRLISKLNGIRKQTEHIKEMLEGVGQVGSMERDIALIQFFILEQFVAYKRFALRHHFFLFDGSTPEKINPIVWILAWLIVIGAIVFFLVWILMWAVLNGPSSFRSWGINFCLSIAQDIFIIQVVKVYVLYVLAMYSIRPQLNFVYRTLNKLAIEYTHVDHFQAPNRSADIRVVQHMSPACRAARLNVSSGLASATILNQMDDLDWQVCKIKHSKTVTVAVLVLLGPGALSVIHVLLGEMFLETMVSTLFSGFMIANYYISVRSVGVLVAIYVVLAGMVLWRFMDKKSAMRRVRQLTACVKSRSFDPHRHTRFAWHTARRADYTHYPRRLALFLGNAVVVSVYSMARTLMSPLVKWRKYNKRNDQMDNAWKNMNLHITCAQMPSHKDSPKPKVLSSWYSNVKRNQSLSRSQSGSTSVSPLASPMSFFSSSSRDLHDVWRINKLAAMGDQLSSLHILDQLPPEILALKSKLSNWKVEKSSPYLTGFGTRLLQKYLFDFDAKHGHRRALKLLTQESLKRWKEKQKNTKRREVERYKLKYGLCGNPQEALSRMLLKILGDTSCLEADGPLVSFDAAKAQAEYDDYDEPVTCAVLKRIMQEVFDMYQPLATTGITDDERHEVMDMFTNWLLECNLQSNTDEIKFGVFREWFVSLCNTILRCAAYDSVSRASLSPFVIPLGSSSMESSSRGRAKKERGSEHRSGSFFDVFVEGMETEDLDYCELDGNSE